MRDTKPVPVGHFRRMADGKNAWRKMSMAQRRQFLAWIVEAHHKSRQDGATDCFIPIGWLVYDESGS